MCYTLCKADGSMVTSLPTWSQVLFPALKWDTSLVAFHVSLSFVHVLSCVVFGGGLCTGSQTVPLFIHIKYKFHYPNTISGIKRELEE